MTPEQKYQSAQEMPALAPLEPVSPQTHAQAMWKMRHRNAGRIAAETNRRLNGSPLTKWDVLDMIRSWHEYNAAEFGKSCLLSGRVPR